MKGAKIETVVVLQWSRGAAGVVGSGWPWLTTNIVKRVNCHKISLFAMSVGALTWTLSNPWPPNRCSVSITWVWRKPADVSLLRLFSGRHDLVMFGFAVFHLSVHLSIYPSIVPAHENEQHFSLYLHLPLCLSISPKACPVFNPPERQPGSLHTETTLPLCKGSIMPRLRKGSRNPNPIRTWRCFRQDKLAN